MGCAVHPTGILFISAGAVRACAAGRRFVSSAASRDAIALGASGNSSALLETAAGGSAALKNSFAEDVEASNIALVCAVSGTDSCSWPRALMERKVKPAAKIAGKIKKVQRVRRFFTVIEPSILPAIGCAVIALSPPRLEWGPFVKDACRARAVVFKEARRRRICSAPSHRGPLPDGHCVWQCPLTSGFCERIIEEERWQLRGWTIVAG